MSILGLPIEIFQMIFEHLRYRQSDLLPLLTICRSLHSEAERLLYRTVVLRQETKEAHRLFFSRVTSCPSLGRGVHSLTLWIGTTKLNSRIKDDGFPYSQLAQALVLMVNLKIFIIKSHKYCLYTPFRLGQILDNQDFKFSLQVFRETTNSVWWNTDGGLSKYPSDFFEPNEIRVNERIGNFIQHQTEIQELEWDYPDVFSSLPMAVPRLRILRASEDSVETLVQGRSVTHLGIAFHAGKALRSSISLPTVEVLFIDRSFHLLGPGLSTAFPRLRVLVGLADMNVKRYLLEHLGHLTNLTTLGLMWFTSNVHSDFDSLLEELFACNPHITTIEIQHPHTHGEHRSHWHAGSHEAISCKRGMPFRDGFRETRMNDDWKWA